MAYFWWKDKKFLWWMIFNIVSMIGCFLMGLPPVVWFLFMFMPFLFYEGLIRWLTGTKKKKEKT